MSWDRAVNLAAYVEVEADSNYATPEALSNYRQLMLQKSAPPAALIEKLVYQGNKLRILELCSGSSRLLYALDGRGLLAEGYGVEVSPSRHRFAEKWKEALGANRIHNIESDIGAYRITHDNLDVAVMIDGALSYIYPCDPELPLRVLSDVHRSLRVGGKVVLEFDVLSRRQIDAIQREGRVRTWNKGDDKDAFIYALYQTEPVDWKRMVFQNTSIYLPRDSAKEKVKREIYKFYSTEEIAELLDAAGFDAEFFGSFAMEPLAPDSLGLIAVATKR
jgi:SAM-dependent methyltransferase